MLPLTKEVVGNLFYRHERDGQVSVTLIYISVSIRVYISIHSHWYLFAYVDSCLYTCLILYLLTFQSGCVVSIVFIYLLKKIKDQINDMIRSIY